MSRENCNLNRMNRRWSFFLFLRRSLCIVYYCPAARWQGPEEAQADMDQNRQITFKGISDEHMSKMLGCAWVSLIMWSQCLLPSRCFVNHYVIHDKTNTIQMLRKPTPTCELSHASLYNILTSLVISTKTRLSIMVEDHTGRRRTSFHIQFLKTLKKEEDSGTDSAVDSFLRRVLYISRTIVGHATNRCFAKVAVSHDLDLNDLNFDIHGLTSESIHIRSFRIQTWVVQHNNIM